MEEDRCESFTKSKVLKISGFGEILRMPATVLFGERFFNEVNYLPHESVYEEKIKS